MSYPDHYQDRLEHALKEDAIEIERLNQLAIKHETIIHRQADEIERLTDEITANQTRVSQLETFLQHFELYAAGDEEGETGAVEFFQLHEEVKMLLAKRNDPDQALLLEKPLEHAEAEIARLRQLLGECIRNGYYDEAACSPSWLEEAKKPVQ